MTDTATHRRTSDKLQNEITALIAAENDHSKRATLIVLNAINQSLLDNTVATYETARDLVELKKGFGAHVSEFTDHARKEEEISNKAKGAWFVLAAVLALAQTVVVWIGKEVLGELGNLHEATHEAKMSDQKIMGRLDALEKPK